MTECNQTDCSKPVVARQMCGAHYRLWRVNGDPTVKTTRWTGHVKVDKTCAIEGCGKPSHKANLCPMHGKRVRLYGDPDVVMPRSGPNRYSSGKSFWAKFGEARALDCWEFPGARNEGGYGQVSFRGQRWTAHRLAYFLSSGEMPRRMVLHRCDNPPCCNPAHLYEGNGSQNMVDMYARNRGNRPTGLDHHMVGYSAENAAEIAAQYAAVLAKKDANGLVRAPRGAVKAIADSWGISVDTVRRIARSRGVLLT